MRPLRFLLLLIFFVALPIALTCWSLLTGTESPADSFNAGYNTRSSRLRALFSFSTPSSLFPPSAVISLTNDNSTFFLARPAAFGPSLPSTGLSGQLWVGKGFGDDALLKEENLHIAGWELGCSDVPGWPDEKTRSIQHLPPVDQEERKLHVPRSLEKDASDHDHPNPVSDGPLVEDDGTDDYLHRPLADSNPATRSRPGESADIDSTDKSKKPTHADIESLQESADIAGKIVMLSRGGCGFLEKVKWAQRRGGIALIVGDNEKGAQLTIMYAKGDTSNVTIPALFTSYTSAHLLSSLVPPESKDDENANTKGPKTSSEKIGNQMQDDGKPVFTSTKTATTKATNTPSDQDDHEKGWVGNVLSAIGLGENSPFAQHEDSRRPPSSGNVEWVLLEDWKEEAGSELKDHQTTLSSVATMSTSTLKPKSTSSRRIGGDDFVIGVQDWRDTELVAPKPVTTSSSNTRKAEKDAADTATSVKTSSNPEASLKGGSITPGSGEYDHEKVEPVNRFNRGNTQSHTKSSKSDDRQDREPGSWLDVFRSSQSAKEELHKGPPRNEKDAPKNGNGPKSPNSGKDEEPVGLWVTLTPTSVSTSPFFDTLLVLVVSPLVTLTVVYGLLLLRSRIRRRRWRAPKSVVERLPVRTYHTMSTTSSTTSSQVASPDHSSPTSPLLISTSQSVSQRPRPRSQTAAGSFAGGTSVESQLAPSRSLQTEKPGSTPKPAKRKRYTGRQVECVVCLEEYVDGESRVMSLPCGHEFHVDCITPWLVTRRRTCPICKGDVVRSMARHGSQSPDEEDTDSESGIRRGEMRSDDVQSRVAQTVNEEPSAAIPIPTISRGDTDADADVERGQDPDVPLLEGDDSLDSSSSTITPRATPQPRQTRDGERHSMWRNIVSASVNRLSGDTLWRQTPVDRNR